MTAKKRRRHTPEQIIRELAEGNKLLAAGRWVMALIESPHGCSPEFLTCERVSA